MTKKTMEMMDGNMAAAYISYAFTETAAIYPITPSSNMAEYTDEWAANGKKNIFGETVNVIEMQSEAGAAGAVHGALQAGSLTTTYTASQGLLLMIPNMYKIAGELLPSVFHVSARQVSTHALSIFGEHTDMYSARSTGFAMIAAGNVQEVMDIGAVAHLATIKGKIPFLHFFDGFRTSHEIQKIETLEYDDLDKLLDHKALQEFRDKALNPEHPVTRGTAQNPDIYFQAREANTKNYAEVVEVVDEYMKEISKLTGREYKPFVYYGDPKAENVIIAMGSVTDTIRETVDYLNSNGESVGAIIVHLYRPFSSKYFLNALPKTCKKIAVLDRTKEVAAEGEPLYQDIRNALFEQDNAPVVVGGRYGLASKDTTPEQIAAVYENLKKDKPKNSFTIGILDDVYKSSLPEGDVLDTVPESMVECKFYGIGADGTVGANKNSIKIIGDNTNKYTQAYFAYDSKKSGGVTISHLRFGDDQIRSTYYVNNPSFVSCSVPAYLNQYDMLRGLKKGGTFLLNSIWDENEVKNHLTDKMKKQLATNDINFYIINATQIAEDIGLGPRTNSIMQSAFFKLANVIPYKDSVGYIKEAVKKTYGKKGANIVEMNCKAIDEGAEKLVKVEIDPAWANLKVNDSSLDIIGMDDTVEPELADFVKNVAHPINSLDGDSLPVSTFLKWPDGTFPNGTSAFEKRGIAVNVPEWICENCIQCNQCSYVCPHAVIRPFLLDENELKNSSELETKKAIGKGLEGLQYRIQIAPYDCTGCGSCVEVCPSKKKALELKPFESQLNQQTNWDYLSKNVTYKDNLMKKNTVKGSQFCRPLFEYSGACAGCGETPYLKLVTQLYGERMMIANATGCSSIYGGSAPSTPFCKNAEGKGPSWASSLFEDNAEYGYGMAIGVRKLRQRVQEIMTDSMDSVSADLKASFGEWLDGMNDGDKSTEATNKLIPLLEADKSDVAKDILSLKQYLIKKSVWVVGGDGWAYDIGFGGLDHVLASGEDINVLVLDTEVYSNTGGQASKSTPTGAIAKFAASGKKVRKKDLGRMAMTYGYVYVAQVAMGASQAQFIKALDEAEKYPGPSIIMAYSPCVAHGIKNKGLTRAQEEEKKAVAAGYWHLYRYNPLLEEEGKNPFVLESKEPDFSKYDEFIRGEVRYASLLQSFPDEADRLFKQALDDAKWRYQNYKRLAEMDYSK